MAERKYPETEIMSRDPEHVSAVLFVIFTTVAIYGAIQVIKWLADHFFGR